MQLIFCKHWQPFGKEEGDFQISVTQVNFQSKEYLLLSVRRRRKEEDFLVTYQDVLWGEVEEGGEVSVGV